MNRDVATPSRGSKWVVLCRAAAEECTGVYRSDSQSSSGLYSAESGRGDAEERRAVELLWIAAEERIGVNCSAMSWDAAEHRNELYRVVMPRSRESIRVVLSWSDMRRRRVVKWSDLAPSIEATRPEVF